MKLSNYIIAYAILAVSILSCAPENFLEDNPDFNAKDSQREDAWICYNPDSYNHGLECSVDCLRPYDVNTFCWYINIEDCNKPHEFEWQDRHCPILY